MGETVSMQCLLCDKPTELLKDLVTGMEAPAAFCPECALLVDSGRIPWPQVHMTYLLRCQIADLYRKLQNTEARLNALEGRPH
jgi:hypothetical protein